MDADRAAVAQSKITQRIVCSAFTLAVKFYHMSTHFRLAIGAALVALALVPASAQKPPAEGKQKNQVEPKRVEQGWIQLFDGKSLNGWRGYNKPDATETSWRLENG